MAAGTHQPWVPALRTRVRGYTRLPAHHTEGGTVVDNGEYCARGTRTILPSWSTPSGCFADSAAVRTGQHLMFDVDLKKVVNTPLPKSISSHTIHLSDEVFYLALQPGQEGGRLLAQLHVLHLHVLLPLPRRGRVGACLRDASVSNGTVHPAARSPHTSFGSYG